ncbi:hypothetical protein AZE42_07039, partial [Rhizopogon vesiculosus]
SLITFEVQLCPVREKSVKFSFNSRKRSTRSAVFRSMANATSGTTGKAHLRIGLLTLSHHRVSLRLRGSWAIVEMDKLWNDLHKTISLVKVNKSQPGPGTFGHIVGGHDAGYFGRVVGP